MAETEKKKQGKFSKWFRELKAETKKIVWPSWKQIKNNTAIVIIMLVIITLVIFAFDTAFGKIVELIVSDGSSIAQIEDDILNDGTVIDEGSDADNTDNTNPSDDVTDNNNVTTNDDTNTQNATN